MRKILTLLFLISTHSASSQVTVGFSSDCDYDGSLSPSNTIQQAIDDGHSEIRVTNEMVTVYAIEITDDLILKGGYNSCAEAQADQPSSSASVVDGTGFSQSIIKIATNGSVRDIVIENFELKNSSGGNGSASNFAGGITIFDSSGSVSLANMLIHNNQDNAGGGGVDVRNDQIVSGTSLIVNIVDTLITNNSSTGSGGGLSCQSNGSITLNVSGSSGVSYNHADNHGGGIYLNHCNMNFLSGTSSPGVSNSLGIHGNTAEENGGGISVNEMSQVTFTGSTLAPVNITANQSNLLGSNKDGGGIYANTDSIIIANNIWLGENEALNASGGAVYAQYGASVTITGTVRDCSWSSFCSLIEGNLSKDGGAIAIEEAASVFVAGTELQGNRTTSSGALANLRDDNSSLTIENSLLHHNGGADHLVFRDWYLIRNSFGNNQITIAYSTVVDNEVQFNSISAYSGSDGDLRLYGTIIDDSPVRPLTVPSTVTAGEVKCVILSDDLSVSNIPSSDHVLVATPAFIDRLNADYHLDPLLTLAIDQCPQSIYTPQTWNDIDNQFRGYDHPDFTNSPGIFDIGMDEFNTDLIFKSSFD